MNLFAKFKNKKNLTSPAKVYKGLKTSEWGRREWSRLAVFLVLFAGIGYLTIRSFAATSDVVHPNGSLITFSGHVYIVEGGQKRPVTSEDALYSNGYTFANVVPANSADNNLPDGPNFNIRAGTLVMSADTGNPSVWIIEDSGNGNYTKWGIPNQDVFNGLGYNYGQVRRVASDAELPPDSPNLITGANHAGGQFVQDASTGIVYMIGIAGKYRVADPSVLSTYPFPLYAANAGDIALPTLGFLPYHEGSIVNSPGTGKVYMMGCADTGGQQGVCNMQKQWFTSPDTMTALGYSTSQAIGGVDGDLDTIPDGGSINAPIIQPPPPPPPTPSGGVDPVGSLDNPAANAQIAVGSVISGWAGDKDTAIHGVQIYIDDKLVPGIANATLGIPRSDVCNAQGTGAYTGLVNCGNNGWQFTLAAENVPNLAIGNHTIHFVATDSDSPTPHTYVSPDRTFAFGNGNPNVQPPPPPPTPVTPPPPPPTTSTGNDPMGSLDYPSATTYPYSQLAVGSVVSGWAGDKDTAIHGVQIYIDGKLAPGGANATLGFSRTDVCNANFTGKYNGLVNCAFLGWQYVLTSANTAGLAAGTHTIHFVATDSDSPTPHHYTSVDRNFTFGNTNPNIPPPPPAPATCPTGQTGIPPNCITPPDNSPVNNNGAHSPYGFIDTPQGNPTISPSGYVIKGWALDNKNAVENSIHGVQIYIDGKIVDSKIQSPNAVYGTPRGDVCAQYAGRPGCPNVGWTFTISPALAATFSSGVHKVHFVATDTDQPTPHTYQSPDNYFMTKVPTTAPDVFIDTPKSGDTLSGLTTITGWALDNKKKSVAPISSIDVFLDAKKVATILSTSFTPRSDVCSLYSGPGCPNVGFSYTLDTSQYKNGPHNVQFVAYAADGYNTYGQNSVNILINNQTVTPPPGGGSRPNVPDRDPATATDLINTGKNEVHFIYVIPKDGVDGQYDINGHISSSISAMNGVLSSSIGKTMNIDTYLGSPDISFIRTNHNLSEYPLGTYGSVNDMLWHDVFDPVSKGGAGFTLATGIHAEHYAVYFDAAVTDNACGASDVGGPGVTGDTFSVAYIGKRPGCSIGGSGLGTGGVLKTEDGIMLHELLHAFGNMSQPLNCSGQHLSSSEGGDNYHVDDSYNDILFTGTLPTNLFPSAVPGTLYGPEYADGQAVLDYGQDDYAGAHVPPNCPNLQTNNLDVH